MAGPAVLSLPPPPPVTFKLRPDERAALRAAAAAVGVGPSTYAADAVRRALGTVRHRAAPQAPSPIAVAVRDATGALGRVGNVVNQLARRSNSGLAFPSQQELMAIRAHLAAIDAHLAKVLDR